MRDLLLVGGGGHCRSVIDVVERTGAWRIVGIVDRTTDGPGPAGYPVLGRDDDLPRLREVAAHALVTVGQIRTARVRAALFGRLQEAGFTMPVVISPRAEVSRRAEIGAGTVVMHFACVNAAASVGLNGIVNTRALIEHDCRVGDHCHVSTASVLNGNVQVGHGSFVGSGALLREGIRIGERCIVVMGAEIRRDVSDDTIATTRSAR